MLFGIPLARASSSLSALSSDTIRQLHQLLLDQHCWCNCDVAPIETAGDQLGGSDYFRLADNTTGTQHDRPNGSLTALFYSLQAIANASMQGVFYSVRSACMGSMEAARRAGIRAAIKPETASKAQTERVVIGSCRPTPKRNA